MPQKLHQYDFLSKFMANRVNMYQISTQNAQLGLVSNFKKIAFFLIINIYYFKAYSIS